jgi:UPF0755 protein
MNTEPTRRPRPRRSLFSWGCLVSFLIPLCLTLALGIYLGIPVLASEKAGPVSEKLSGLQRLQYSALMVFYADQLTTPLDDKAGEIAFTINDGQGAASVANALELAGIIRSADAFTAYLVYSGLDTGIQAGEFQLSPALSSIQIAAKIQDATPTQVKFIVLPGWRLEEVAAALPTSGLNITPQQFIQAAENPQSKFDFIPPSGTAEGFFLPGQYTLPRVMQARELVAFLMNNTALVLTPELRAGFSRQNLSVYQAVTLASIVQREAIMPEEQPVIASVFLNRLSQGMRLETDPTIQYALGYNQTLQTWWKVPLTVDDLGIASPFNTYQNAGLPPGPICSPSLSALQAVAYPAQTPYYYFRARCDGSGLHNFSETYDQHLQNGCQ